MQKINFIYDDTIEVSDRAKTIIGKNSFGEMILKRKKLYEYAQMASSEYVDGFYKIRNNNDFRIINKLDENDIYFHILSTAAILDSKEFELILQKSKFIKETTAVVQGDTMALIFPNRELYDIFLKKYLQNKVFNTVNVSNIINANCFSKISDYNKLLMYISSGFDARYFNSLQGDEFTITKKSHDKKKMHMEYQYYWLLPDDMKNWMVMPFDYKEEKDFASYSMERMPMTDIAIRWTHGAVTLEEMDKILEKTFHFFNIRHQKEVSKEEFLKLSDSLYLNKLLDRVEKLKKCKEFPVMAAYISNGTDYESIDAIINDYVKIYKNCMKNYCKKAKTYKAVIGHGDVFFANMLYSKEINLLRLIDPKGAISEDELWSNPFYDIAKLSHSICGNYDFFNANLYDIYLDSDMKFKLNIDFDNTKYKNLFKNYLQKNGLDYKMIRTFEASLFLSMLPLHIDNPHKVFGFLLNGINIIKELKEYV